jgi:hypothetical protein
MFHYLADRKALLFPEEDRVTCRRLIQWRQGEGPSTCMFICQEMAKVEWIAGTGVVGS